jgi:LPXTG-motif cell wall-anchored protein
MKKAFFAAAVGLAAIGGMSTAVPGAFAGVYPPDTTIATPSDPVPADRTGDPVVTEPVTEVKSNTPAGSLPTTGANTGIALQVGALTMVAGMTAVVAVRRRRPQTA